jgi:flagellar motor component MotA
MLMKAFNNFLSVVLGIALLVALIAGGYFLIRYIAGVFGKLEPQLATVTAIVSVVTLLFATIIASGLKSRDFRELIRVEKAQLYQQLLFVSYRWDPSEREDSDAEVEHLKLKQHLALWGSPTVITTYAELERRMSQEESHSDGLKPLLKQLVMEMRKDLGQTTSNIEKDDLLYLLIEKSNQQKN